MNNKSTSLFKSTFSSMEKINILSEFTQISVESLKFTPQIDTIKFQHHEDYSQILYNRELKLKNQAHSKLIFKIRSNHPEHYQVNPFKAVLNPGQTVQINFQLMLNYSQKSCGVNDLIKYELDKFQISWTSGEEDMRTKQNFGKFFSKQFAVQIIVLKQNSMNNSHQKHKKQFHEERAYKSMLESNQNKIKQLQIQIEMLKKNKVKKRMLSKNNFCLLAIISIIIGFWLGGNI